MTHYLRGQAAQNTQDNDVLMMGVQPPETQGNDTQWVSQDAKKPKW